MRRKTRPANEEFGNILYSVLFVILWYSGITRALISGGYRFTLLLFLVAGLIPLYTVFMQVRRAMFYRRQRAQAIAWGNYSMGRITGVTVQKEPYYAENRQRARYRNYYYYQVEIVDPSTGVENTIQSEGYRKPLHRYLASDRVKVYQDQSGWKYYLEEFQYKKHRNDPGILLYSPRDFEETAAGSSSFLQILIFIVMILMIFNIIFQ